MAPWLIPLITSLAGGYLSHRGKKSQEKEARTNEEAAQRKQWEEGRGVFERDSRKRAYRAQIAQQLMAKWMPGISTTPDVQGTSPTQYPEFKYVPGQVKSSTTGDIGSFLSSIAPFAGGGRDESGPSLTPIARSGMASPSGPSDFQDYLRRYNASGAETPRIGGNEISLEDLYALQERY